MNLRWMRRLIAGSLRRGRTRMAVYVACLAVGVSAVVGVAALSDAVERGIRGRSRELLGGDIAVESQQPIPELSRWFVDAELRAHSRFVRTTTFSTMVRNAHGDSRLVELKAIDDSAGSYPLAGKLEVDPPSARDALHDGRSALVGDELADGLRLSPGDTLQIGKGSFRVAGRVRGEPQAVGFSGALGPRVLIGASALAHTELVTFGSRVRYRVLIAVPGTVGEAALADLRDELAQKLPSADGRVSVETHREAQPQLRATLRRVERAIALVALLSLLLAGAGVALLVATWLAEARTEIAVLRCLGARPAEVALVYTGQIALLSLAGTLLGCVLGTLLPSALHALQPAMLPAPGLAGALWPALRGLALGVSVPLLCSAPALLAVWQVPPSAILRSDARALPLSWRRRLLVWLGPALACLGAAWLESGSSLRALAFSGGVVLLTGLLWLATTGIARALSRLPRRRISPLLWHGISAITRPNAGATGSVVALGMGALVVLSITLVEQLITSAVDVALPKDAPGAFLLDVQPDQWEGVARLAHEHGASRVESAPVIMGRLKAIDGTPVSALLAARTEAEGERSRAHWVLTREQRITIASTLPADNRIVAGTLFAQPAVNEVSVETGFARDLGAKLGSVLRFDVQGVPIDLTVTSLRSVEWRSFHVNFFLLVEPGPLDDAPQFRIAAVHGPVQADRPLQDALAQAYPNVSVINVRHMLAQAAGLFGRAALALRWLGSFATVTGLVVLVGSIASSQLKRRREAAVLKVLGLTRAQVVGMFAVEYALLGALAGLVGAGAAYALELPASPSAWVCILGALGTALLAVVSGLLASVRALQVPPAEAIRDS